MYSPSHKKAILFQKTSKVWNILLFIKPESTSLLLSPLTLSSSALWINSTDIFFVSKYKRSTFILGLTKNKSLKTTDTRGAERGHYRVEGMRKFTITYELFKIIIVYSPYYCDIQNGNSVRIV